MSFILDALKKLEQNQQDSVPHLASIHTHNLHRPAKRPVWPYLLLAALVLNAGILLAWLGPWNSKTEDAAILPAVSRDHVLLSAETVNKATEVIALKPSSAVDSGKPETIIEPAPMVMPSKTETAPLTPSEEPSSDRAPESDRLADLELNPSVQELESLRNQIKEELAVVGINNELPAEEPDENDNDHYKAVSAIPEKAIPELSELPIRVRKEIPEISIFGHIYSENPTSRLVNINGSIVREGETVTRRLKVKEITMTGVIFDYQGLHFRIRAF